MVVEPSLGLWPPCGSAPEARGRTAPPRSLFLSNPWIWVFSRGVTVPRHLGCGFCRVAGSGPLFSFLSNVLRAEASPDQGPVPPDPNAYRARSPIREAAGAPDGNKR